MIVIEQTVVHMEHTQILMYKVLTQQQTFKLTQLDLTLTESSNRPYH